MTKHKEGSGILIIFIIIHLVALHCLYVWKTTQLYVELSLQKQMKVQQTLLLDGTLWWAIDMLKKTGVDGLKKQIIIDLTHWPYTIHMFESSNIQIMINKKNDDTVECIATLIHNNKKLLSKKCILKMGLQKDTKLSSFDIQKWHEK